MLGDNDDDDDLFGERSLILPDDKSRSKLPDSSPRDTGSPRNRKRSRGEDDALLLDFLSSFLFSRSTDSTTPKTLVSDEDTRDSEAPVVTDDTHDPNETPVVLETPVVDDDYFHVKKKPCLDDRDKKPGLEE